MDEPLEHGQDCEVQPGDKRVDAGRTSDPRHRVAPHLAPRARGATAAGHCSLRERSQGCGNDTAKRGGTNCVESTGQPVSHACYLAYTRQETDRIPPAAAELTS